MRKIITNKGPNANVGQWKSIAAVLFVLSAPRGISHAQPRHSITNLAERDYATSSAPVILFSV